MAKNRIVSDRKPKTKDNFFKKVHSKFRNPKSQHKNRKEEIQQTPSSNNFFVKSNSAGTSKDPETSKVSNLPDNQEPKRDKKPFDKKKYRLQKYSKKYKLQQWEDKRKKSVLRGYYKSLKEDEINPVDKIYEEENEVSENDVEGDVKINKNTKTDEGKRKETLNAAKQAVPTTYKEKRNKSFRKAQQEFQRIKEEKEKKRDTLLKKISQVDEALVAYKKKKTEKFKKLNQKNKKGQPIMKGRIEMLLEKIQNSVNQE